MVETLHSCTLGSSIKEKLMSKGFALNNQDTLVRVACTFVFSLFAFFYLYYFQADLLTVTQHVLSQGQTHYNHFIGTILITMVLLFVQVVTANLLKKVKMAWAFTFVPSVLCLIMLTDVHPVLNESKLEFGAGVYLCPIALVVYLLLVWLAHSTGLTAAFNSLDFKIVRRLWANLTVLFSLMALACLCGNNDRVYHVRIHAEQCILNGDFEGALDAIKHCDEPDENLTMLTAYALSRNKQLPESLFEYQLKGGSKAMMPNGTTTRFELLPDTSFYAYLGNCYRQRMQTMHYLNYQKRHKRMNKVTADYMLCGYLLDKKLDLFVREITKHYAVNDSVSLPKHYEEALLLYTHLHSTPYIIYKNDVMNADFQDFQKLENTILSAQRKTALRDTYGNTYWYYYQYE